MATFEKVRDLILRGGGIDPESEGYRELIEGISPNTTLADDLGLSVPRITKLIVVLEKEFDIELSLWRFLESHFTIRDVINHVEALLAQKIHV